MNNQETLSGVPINLGDIKTAVRKSGQSVNLSNARFFSYIVSDKCSTIETYNRIKPSKILDSSLHTTQENWGISDLVESEANPFSVKDLFSFQGRDRRSKFLLINSVAMCINIGLNITAVSHGSPLVVGVSIFMAATLFWIQLASLGRRFHDIGYTAKFVLLSFIPFIGQLLVPFALFKSGSEGDNEYGDNPREPVW